LVELRLIWNSLSLRVRREITCAVVLLRLCVYGSTSVRLLHWWFRDFLIQRSEGIICAWLLLLWSRLLVSTLLLLPNWWWLLMRGLLHRRLLSITSWRWEGVGLIPSRLIIIRWRLLIALLLISIVVLIETTSTSSSTTLFCASNQFEDSLLCLSNVIWQPFYMHVPETWSRRWSPCRKLVTLHTYATACFTFDPPDGLTSSSNNHTNRMYRYLNSFGLTSVLEVARISAGLLEHNPHHFLSFFYRLRSTSYCNVP